MDIDFIARLLDLVERSKVAELDLTLNGERLRLVKSAASAPARAIAPEPSAAAAPVPAPRDSAKPLHAIRAGFPGTFYRAPAPGEKPFAEVGSRVEDGTQIAILEAMKTMNPVEADLAGIVRRIAVEDAAAVETGALLFEIESDAGSPP
jgi:acetyl-CoA carboxylase biotin carboxyl carrier protein